MKYYPFIVRVDLSETDEIIVNAQFMGVSRRHQSASDVLPLSQEELNKSAEWLERGYIDAIYAQELGSRLFRFVFQGDVLQLLHDADARLAADEGLRVLLQLPVGFAEANALAKSLVTLPWELMYDERYGYLALSRTVPLVFHDPSANLPNRLPDGSGPLRVLLVAASPQGTDSLQSAQEIGTISKILSERNRLSYKMKLIYRHTRLHGTLRGLPGRLRNLRHYDVTTVAEATRASIRQCLDKARGDGEPFHVIHFIGHGEFDGGVGYLLLNSEDNENGVDRITAEAFVDLVADRNLNLLLINACQTASVNPLLASVAERAFLRGTPVVIGMRMNVLDDVALSFARDFYRSLAGGEPVEAAMATARQLTKRETPGQAPDWSIPRMFMGWSQGLALPEMKVRRLTLPQLAWRSLLFLVALLGVISTLIGVPTLARTIATEVPGIKCLALYPMDDNKFTVAFYPFGVTNENGRYVITDDGGDLAQFLFNRFEQSFAELDLGLPYELRPPSQACAIRGRDSEERTQHAAEIAEHINADVIIYGTITDADVDPRLRLEFHVSYKGFNEGDEITGPYALGNQLPVDLPFDPESLLAIAHPIHIVWTDILSAITIGLSYYTADDFRSAIDYLQMAEQTPQWPKSDGKEIIHLLLGNAHLRLATKEMDLEGYHAAKEHYQKAQEIEPAYTRARVGEANTDYLIALGDPNNRQVENFDDEMLDVAEDKFLEALIAAERSDDRTTLSRIRFGLGQIYLARAIKEDSGNLAESDSLKSAVEQFESVIQAFTDGDDRLSYQASHAYYYLALVMRENKEYDQALSYYESAVEHASPYYRAEYAFDLSKMFCRLNKTADSMVALRSAIDTARVYGYADLVDKYVAELNLLEQEGCE